MKMVGIHGNKMIIIELIVYDIKKKKKKKKRKKSSQVRIQRGKEINNPLTLVLRRGLQQPPNSFRPGAQNHAAKG